MVLVFLLGGVGGQVLAILLGVVAGLILCRQPRDDSAEAVIGFRVRTWVSVTCLVVFAVLLFGLPLVVAVGGLGGGGVALFDAFYRAGALVFGGGHVVLPLLEAEVVAPGWVGTDAFLVGYGAAQAMPGPLFTFAGYLGALSTTGPGGIAGATIALIAVFAPGFLLLVGVLAFWDRFRRMPWAQAAMRGANAAVVGVLGAALYSPVFTSSAVTGPAALCLALVCFVLLVAWKLPPWLVVIVGAVGGVVGALASWW